MENALVSYGSYLSKTIWPTNLIALYPIGGAIPVGNVLLWGFSLVAITLIAVLQARHRPFIAFGWLWYLITLLPMIGILQSGYQSMADRFTYIPLIGIFVTGTWTLCEFIDQSSNRKAYGTALAICILFPCLLLSRAQIEFWRDSLSVFGHVLAVEPRNSLAQNNFGNALVVTGRVDEAIPHFRAAVEIADNAQAYLNLGNILYSQQRFTEAIQNYKNATRTDPQFALAHNNLGLALAKQGSVQEAVTELLIAIQLNPTSAQSRNDLGVVLAKAGRIDEAIDAFRQALKMNPADQNASANLADLQAMRRDMH
jgi:tetratricopeptide (TPR) repeat protein